MISEMMFEFVGMVYYPEADKIFNINMEELIANELMGENDWEYISKYCKLTEQILETFKNKINWERLCWNPTLTLKLINKFANYMDWDTLSKYYHMPEDFMEEHKYFINWTLAYDNYNVPENFSITF